MTTSEHLTFLALLVPTFILMVAAAISLSNPEPAVLTNPVTLAAPADVYPYPYPVDACRCEGTY